QLGIHPEMLSPAILNRSMPRIPVSDMRSSLPHEFPSLKHSVLVAQAYREANACACPNFASEFRSLALICPNLHPIYHKPDNATQVDPMGLFIIADTHAREQTNITLHRRIMTGLGLRKPVIGIMPHQTVNERNGIQNRRHHVRNEG